MTDGATGAGGETPFDSDDFLRRLRALNADWLGDLALPTADDWSDEHGHSTGETFVQARKSGCMARYRAGKDAWNAWAQGMLALRAELEAAEKFDGETRSERVTGQYTVRLHDIVRLHAQNAETAAWAGLVLSDFVAAIFGPLGAEKPWPRDAEPVVLREFIFPDIADFRGAQFRGVADLRGAQFRGVADLRGAQFRGRADLRGALFRGVADLRGAQFRGDADLRGAQFRGYADLSGAQFRGRADLRGAQFRGYAVLRGAQFRGYADLEGAQFRGFAKLSGAQFRGRAHLRGAQFRGDADLEGAQFRGRAVLEGAQFRGRADFSGACFDENANWRAIQFRGEARFKKLAFLKDATVSSARFKSAADFTLAQFHGATSFEKARFAGRTDFEAAQGKDGSSFTLAGAQFREPPNFIQAHFQEAPRLDNVEVAQTEKFDREERALPDMPDGEDVEFSKIADEEPAKKSRFDRTFGIDRDPDLPARWRNLKRLAIEAHDHQRELEFFAGELKALRWVEHFPFGRKAAAYWFGVFYGVLSNFGRSILRPIYWWLLCFGVAAALYLSLHFSAPGRQLSPGTPLSAAEWVQRWFSTNECVAGSGGAPWSEALHLSAAKGLVFIGLASGGGLNQSYACLYGIERDGPQPAILGDNFTPRTPGWVSLIAGAQQLISILLLALFLLAVRGHFRIR